MQRWKNAISTFQRTRICSFFCDMLYITHHSIARRLILHNIENLRPFIRSFTYTTTLKLDYLFFETHCISLAPKWGLVVTEKTHIRPIALAMHACQLFSTPDASITSTTDPDCLTIVFEKNLMIRVLIYRWTTNKLSSENSTEYFQCIGIVAGYLAARICHFLQSWSKYIENKPKLIVLNVCFANVTRVKILSQSFH